MLFILLLLMSVFLIGSIFLFTVGKKPEGKLCIAGAVIIIFLLLIQNSSKFIVLPPIKNENQLETIVASEDEVLVYFGRPSCTACGEVYPLLQKYSLETGQTIYYYNTDVRRGDAGFLQIMQDYSIERVPIIIVYKDSVMIRAYSYREILQEFDGNQNEKP